MSKILSSESLIGNYILAAVEKGDSEVNLDKLFEYESRLSSQLSPLGYSTHLDYTSILDFSDNYPFFIGSVNESSVPITSSDDPCYLRNRLVRHFRMGLPKVVVNAMKNVSEDVLKE